MKEFERVNTTVEKLLYAILIELRKLNKEPDNPSSNICPLCGKDHSNKGFALSCARKNKTKEGVKK